MRRKIFLHGKFEAYASGPIEIVSTTVAEAIEALSRLVPGFEPDPLNGRKRIVIAGCGTREDLFAPSDMAEIHVFPQLKFGKSGGLIQILVGAVLIAASFIPGIAGTPLQSALIGGGIGMIAGGLLQLIAPQPKNTPDTRSRYIATTQNTVEIGTPIPILYGYYKVGGQILSLSVTSQNQKFSS